MPSFVTHDYFAAEVLAHAPEELSALCRQHAAVYSWGAQGFDPLCYHYAPLGGPLSGCGRALHHIPPVPLLEALAKAADGEKNDAARAWLLGLCTHYILDRTLSPLIRAVAHERLAPQHPGMAAKRLENLCATDLDRAVAEECITAEPVLFPAYRLLQTAHAALRAPSQMLALCASRVTEGNVSAAMCARAMRDMRRVHETLFYGGDTAYDKLRASEADAGHTGRLSALKMRTLPLPADCANRSRRVWHDFGGVPRTADAFILLERAQAALPPVWEAVWLACTKGVPLPAEMFDRDFSGLPISSP